MSEEYVETLITEAIEEYGGEGEVNWDDLGMDVDNLSQTAFGRLSDSTLEDIAEDAAPKIIRQLRGCLDQGGETERKVRAALGIEKE